MLLVPAARAAGSSIATVKTPAQAAIGIAARTAADTRSAVNRVRRRGQRSTQVPAGRPISIQGSHVAAGSRATMPTLACRVDTATSGRATVVIAEPKPLIDSPAQNKPKSRVRRRPPTRLGRTVGREHSGASGSVLMRVRRSFRPRRLRFPGRMRGGDEREAYVVADYDAQRLRLRKVTPPRIIRS